MKGVRKNFAKAEFRPHTKVLMRSKVPRVRVSFPFIFLSGVNVEIGSDHMMLSEPIRKRGDEASTQL